jgi:biopolymer transport protein ExbD
MKLEERRETIAEINVVPLVDIVLVILIIFMVSAPLFIKPSLEVQLPQAASVKDTKTAPINLTLASDGRLDMNGDLVSLETMSTRIGEKLKENPDVSVVIAADKAATHGLVVEVLDRVRRLGIKKFALNVEAN